MPDQGPEQVKPEVSDHELLHLIATGSYGQVWLERTFDVNVAQIYIAKHKVAKLINQQVRQLERASNQPGG